MAISFIITKNHVKEEMIALIEHYYEKADKCDNGYDRSLSLAKIAGIETLACRLKIKLWEK